MEYRFGSSNIITCYIKELLHSFNLPKVDVYTKRLEEKVDYKDESGSIQQSENSLYDGKVYIKDDLIVEYKDGKFKKIANYVYNYPVVNFTKKFIIKSSVYDHYTHYYLGDYLRFIRDYKGIDLMSLYNCFLAEEPGRIYLQRDDGTKGVKINSNYYFTIDTDSPEYLYYIVPVKFDQTYTFALNINSGYDIACILYNNVFLDDTPDELIKQSFKHIEGSTFYNPFTYSTKFSCTRDKELWKREKDLKLILKIPKNANTTITILEGDFSQNGNIAGGCLYSDSRTNINTSSIESFNLLTKSSLLNLDDKISRPFADRLIEYLLKHAITSDDYIPNNIEYVQEMIYPTGVRGYYGIWDNQLRYNIYQRTLENDILKGNSKKYSPSFVEFSDGGIMLKNGTDLEYILYAPSLSTKKWTLGSGEELVVYNIEPGKKYELEENDILVIKYKYPTGEKDSEGREIFEKVFLGMLGEGTVIVNNTSTLENCYTESLITGEVYEWSEEKDLKNISISQNENLKISYSETTKKEIRFIDTHTDILGYVDRDTESLLKLQSKMEVE